MTEPAAIPRKDRWFFALQPTAAAREEIVRLQDALAARHGLHGYRLKPQNLHLSLHGLGEGDTLSESRLSAARAAAASVGADTAPFEVAFDQAKTFTTPSPRKKPFVLCETAKLEPLHAFHRAFGITLRNQEAGHQVRNRFSPHLTLFWDDTCIEPLSVAPIRWRVDEFVLIRSRAGRGEHSIVERWSLGVAAAPEPPKPITCTTRPRPKNKDTSTYAELHARSAFSFLRGGSIPEDLARAALELELPAMALLDRDGVYGAPRFFSVAKENEFALRPRVGAEITMEDGTVVPLLAASQTGYQNLCQLITETKLTERPHHIIARLGRGGTALPDEHAPDPRDRKRPCFATWAELARYSEGLIALTGDEEGPVRTAWRTRGASAAAEALGRLTEIFGADADPARARLFIELQRHRLRGEEREIGFLRDLAAAQRLPLIATGGINYAIPEHRIVSDVFTCLRHHTTLDAAGRRLEVNHERHVKSSVEMAELFGDLPDALANTLRLEARLDFTLKNLGYKFPSAPTPSGVSMDEHLRRSTYSAALAKVPHLTREWKAQLDRELALIAKLGFSGYFLIVADICRWARDNNILVQGRGSAANSSVCYVLGITAVDPIKNRLLFDRFLTDGRLGSDGNPSWPDIDLDFPSGERREKVIQEVYQRYGRRGAAMTANVIAYRGRSTIREMGKVLGFGEDALDRFSSLYANGDFPQTLELKEQLKLSGISEQHPRAEAMVRLRHHVHTLPRHLGQHSGGMVVCAGQLDKIVPLEPATMPDRSVCQWDKDDCENLGIVKIDFLGLGMMAVMQESIELCSRHGNRINDINDIPPDDPLTYERIRAADTVGVFQIESRAQMATLPRFLPKNLYDLAMQVAIVRPGPITGNLVHPLIRRRNKQEDVDYIDPSVAHIVEPILERTKGVILFQEQMLQLAIKLAKFSGAEAEELRRAMGFEKDPRRLPKSMAKLRENLRREGYNETVIQKVVTATTSFSAYGFPESHAIGFAMLAYASTWLKIHRPAEFYASLLNNQPMGFYSPATLLQDGRRHGLVAHPVCVQHSGWNCTVEGDKLIRIGLRYVKGMHQASIEAMIAERATRGPFASLEDFLRRTDLNATERRALAAVGAFSVFTSDRRSALWQVEAAWSDSEALLKHYADVWGKDTEGDSPLFAMSRSEELQADFFGLGLTTSEHPMALLRPRLTGITPAKALKDVPDGQRVTIAGAVICRQRPGTAKGFVFISLEDETGIANAVVIPALFERLRLTITQEPALRITGPLQNVSNVTHVKAETIEPFREADLPTQTSHDFH
ncbi:MAG TPA: error-prone DNA polymerase [Opitutaceae bacterium]